MKKNVYIALGVIGIALSVWIWVTVGGIVQSEQNVQKRFAAVVQYYGDMRTEYTDPLQNVPGITDDDRRALADISTHLQQMESGTDPDEQYEQLLSVQREMIAFFTKPSTSEALTTDLLYAGWNTNATNNGGSSQFLSEYNQALRTYNAAMQSPVGGAFGFFPHWNHPEYLSVDGTTQEATWIKF